MIHLIRQSYRPDGGAEKAILDYSKAFDCLEWDHSVICGSQRQWPGSAKHRVILRKSNREGRASIKGFRDEVSRLIDQYPCDLFQAHDWIPGSQIIRLGDGLHSTWLSILNSRSTYIERAARKILPFHRQKVVAQTATLTHPNLRRIIVNSEMVKRELISQYPEVESKVVTIRNIVDINVPPIVRPPQHSTFGFMGSGWARKGLPFVLKALALLPKSRLIVGGLDSRVDSFKQMAVQLGVADRVRWVGLVKDPYAFYGELSALILPALYDPSPNVVLESMAVGCPVVISERTGAVDFKDLAGVVVSRTRADDLAYNMSQAGSLSGTIREELVAKAREYNPDYLCRKVQELYKFYR